MATRRRIGVSIASTEAARRQLMQPVPCWERMSVPSDINPNVKVYKWIKTDKVPHFSDDELDADEPLAPLPDEPEIVEGDEDMEQDEPAISSAPVQGTPAAARGTAEPEVQEEDASKAPSPQPKLTMSTEDAEHDSGDIGGGLQLDDSLKHVDVNMGNDEAQGDINEEDQQDADNDQGPQLELNMAGLGPDGLPLESAHDLAQLHAGDAIAGPTGMDHSEDPFAPVP